MTGSEVREPIQKRSIETKEKIIKAGFDLICEEGYHNTNTSKIAKKAGVSTGIVYQYFKDKKAILLAGLEKYSDQIFFPMQDFSNITFNKNSLGESIKNLIKTYLKNHKLSQTAHEEITAMAHTDKEIASYFYQREMDITNKFVKALEESGFEISNIYEKVHIAIGMIDNLCHEIVYHKHKELDYNVMARTVAKAIVNLL